MFRHWIWPIVYFGGCVVAMVGTTLLWGIIPESNAQLLHRFNTPGLRITGWGTRLTNKTDTPIDLAADLQLLPGETVIYGPGESAKLLTPDGRTKRIYPGINAWMEKPLGVATLFLGLTGAGLAPTGFRPRLAKFIYLLCMAFIGVVMLLVLVAAVTGVLDLRNTIFFLLLGLAVLSLPLLALEYRFAPFLFLVPGVLGVLMSAALIGLSLFPDWFSGPGVLGWLMSTLVAPLSGSEDFTEVLTVSSLICTGLGLSVLIRKDAVNSGLVPLAIGGLMFLFSAGTVVWSIARHLGGNVSIPMAIEYFAPFRECWTGVAVTIPGAAIALIAAVGWAWTRRARPSDGTQDVKESRARLIPDALTG